MYCILKKYSIFMKTFVFQLLITQKYDLTYYREEYFEELQKKSVKKHRFLTVVAIVKKNHVSRKTRLKYKTCTIKTNVFFFLKESIKHF